VREKELRMNRSLKLVFVLCVASLVPVRARTDATTTVLCKDGTTAMGGRGACHGHGGVDKTGGSAPKAAAPAEEHEASAGGPVTCKDGSSWPKAGRGACRGHGGVDKTGGAAPKAAAPAEEHEASAGGPVTCKDGSSWPKAGRGACRGHGGVLKAGTAPTPPPVPRAAAPTPPPPRPSAPAAQGYPTPGPAVATKSKHASNDPTGALARCKDGMYWHGTRHSGSCSRHGGVAEWLQGPS
jgi:Protein of unknown function (DUF3761)